MRPVYCIALLAAAILLSPMVLGMDQNTVATIVATENYDWSQLYGDTNSTVISIDGSGLSQLFGSASSTTTSTESYDWPQMYADTNSTVISIGGSKLPFQQTVYNQQVQNTPTAPVISHFSYDYNKDANTITLSFTLFDPDTSTIYATAYATVDGNIHVLDSSIEVSSGEMVTKTYHIYPEPSAVYISFISEAPGAYPQNIRVVAPKFVVATTAIPIDFDYSGNVIIMVSNGYSIYPLKATNHYRAYVIASSSGIVGITVKPVQ